MKLKYGTLSILAMLALLLSPGTAADAAPHLYEEAYVNGHTVTISAKDPFPGKPSREALSDYFEVIYPIGWQDLTDEPLCNPCDHGGDGDDFFDYHDHVFSAEPAHPGGGEFTALWLLHFVVPAYTGNAALDAEISAAYAAYLPVKSVADIQILLAATLPDGSPIAMQIDTDYAFLVAIVDSSAAH